VQKVVGHDNSVDVFEVLFLQIIVSQ